LVKVFSVPDLESITVEPDGKSLSIIIKTNIQDFKIRATIASSRESLSVDKSILQKSMPVVALQLTGDELTIVGVAMQGEKNAYAKTQIVVPIKFDGQSAQDWHTRLLKREADEKLAAEQKEKAIAKQTAEMNKEQDNKISRQQQRDLTQDPVYRYTNNLIAQLNTYPPCVMFARAMRDMASSQAPDEIRERQVDKIFDKIPDSCIRQ